MNDIQGLTLWEPWASLIALRVKHYETRSWPTSYRGKLAIHAAKRKLGDDELELIWEVEKLTGKALNPVDYKYPLGCIVAITDLTECRLMTDERFRSGARIFEQTELELAVGNWQPGRYAWKLENIIALPEPIPMRGHQGLRYITDTSVLEAIAAQGVEL